MKYLLKFKTIVHQMVAEFLLVKVILVIDGHTKGFVHHLACFASLLTSSDEGYRIRLLTIFLLEDKTKMDAD